MKSRMCLNTCIKWETSCGLIGMKSWVCLYGYSHHQGQKAMATTQFHAAQKCQRERCLSVDCYIWEIKGGSAARHIFKTYPDKGFYAFSTSCPVLDRICKFIWHYKEAFTNILFLGLSLEQVDILWHCLVEDSECYDDALHWFLNQVRSKDQHAMGMETYKHLFLEKVYENSF